MQAGFQATHAGRLFSSQVEYYRRRIEEAERDLHDLVFYAGNPSEQKSPAQGVKKGQDNGERDDPTAKAPEL
jgi:hypothetical protein